ncbi:MAG: cyclic nucleotide-binding domain-containing protein [Oscillospiraceae bacterium]|nr:cyclic nucleotide-binding domain-containing protein [Oscillospiraceae bacterium]
MITSILILKSNEIIFKQGDKSDCMYDIRMGRVGIYANYGTKEEKLLTELTTDQFFGEMGIMEGYPRSATAVALGDVTELTVVAKEDFEDYCKNNPEKAILIMKNMSSRIRDLTQSYLEVCRTVAEYMDAEQKAEKGGLLNRLKKYRDEYNAACQYAATQGIEMSSFGYYNW